MLFHSPEFLFLFLPIVVIVYFGLVKLQGVTVSKIWLVAASLFFYGYASQQYSLLVVSVAVNYFFGILLSEPKCNGRKIFKKSVLWAALLANVGLLAYFKYADFFVGNVNLFLGTEISLSPLAFPLAISFFTFQQISYVVDCYQGKAKERSFLDYCVYVLFFPQLIAGPIVRHREFMPQFTEERNRRVNWNNIAAGVFAIALGLFKKIVVADFFNSLVNMGFGEKQPLGLADAWTVSLSYTCQIYYDFSAYTDMAIGAALLFNIRLPINFNSPYKALNIQEFWQRWHITLSLWLRDYLYIPLGGNRSGLQRTVVNILITFLIGGLWHGAGWTFVFWGGLHGVALAAHRLWQTANLKLPSLAGWLCTFLFINFSWVFFRAPNMDSAVGMMKGMLGFSTVESHLVEKFMESVPLLDYLCMAGFCDGANLTVLVAGGHILILALFLFGAPNSMEVLRFASYSGAMRFRADIITAVFTGLLFVASFFMLLGNVPQGSFLYFKF